MATCNPQTLLDADPCWLTLTLGQQQLIEVQMLCNLWDKLANAGEVTCDPQELLEQAKCLPNDWRQLQAIKLQLLCEISGAI